MSSFVDELLAAPNGALLLARLEAEQRGSVAELAFGEMVTLVAAAATELGGPWNASVVGNLTDAYEQATDRRALAEAVAARFESALRAGPDLAAQEVWICEHRVEAPLECFGDLGRVYGNGEFTWAALRTATSHPADAHIEFSVSTDSACESTNRWRLPVRADVRVWRIDAPSDWVRLVATYPRPASCEHGGWELPGPNQRGEPGRGVDELERRSAGRAARTTIRGHVLPDWAAIAEDYDGVHLSWWGYLTTEGLVLDVDDGAVTMLRYWDGEQTHWLADVFGEPEPIDPPLDDTRREQDRDVIRSMLGR